MKQKAPKNIDSFLQSKSYISGIARGTSGGSREFWRKINKVFKKPNDDSLPIEVEQMGDYFKSLLESPSNKHPPSTSSEVTY